MDIFLMKQIPFPTCYVGFTDLFQLCRIFGWVLATVVTVVPQIKWTRYFEWKRNLLSTARMFEEFLLRASCIMFSHFISHQIHPWARNLDLKSFDPEHTNSQDGLYMSHLVEIIAVILYFKGYSLFCIVALIVL